MGRENRGEPQGAPALEWAVGLLGALLVAATVGFLLYDALRDNGTPPDVRITAEAPIALQNGWLVPITLLNQGGTTASGLRVEGELRGPEGAVQRSETIFDYLPPRSPRKGGLFFSEDPGRYALTVRAVGYTQP